jgi:hypothetical protein
VVDFAVPIVEGRLLSQALRLATAPFRPALILEGTELEFAQTGMRWESL